MNAEMSFLWLLVCCSENACRFPNDTSLLPVTLVTFFELKASCYFPCIEGMNSSFSVDDTLGFLCNWFLTSQSPCTQTCAIGSFLIM